MRSATPAQKVSGASTIEEFNHGKVYFRVAGGRSEPQFRGRPVTAAIPDG